MAPSATVVAALLRLSHADDEQSMLQMPAVVEKHVATDGADCACPGYYEEQCTANAFQGCVWTSEDLGAHPLGWTDQGASNDAWCQCDPNFVGEPPLFPPAPPPFDPNAQAPAAICPAGWEQVGAAGADIGGCGLQSCDERYDITSEAACAARCDATAACVGFSYAPMNGDRNHPGVTACTIYNSDSPSGTWTGTQGLPTQVFCKPTPTGATWLIGSAVHPAETCDQVCAAAGGSCSQSELDALNGASSADFIAKYAEAGHTCNPSRFADHCSSGSNCVNWGSPYIHNSHFDEGLCWGGSTPTVAPCGQQPVDGNHRRLCPCDM